APDPIREGLPLDVLERRVAPALALLEAVDRRDVRMVERCQNARLALESLEVFRIGGGILGERLERNGAAQPRIVREENDPHPAAPDLAVYPIRAYGGAGGRRHKGPRVSRTWGRGTLPALSGQETKQLGVYEELFPSERPLLEQADGNQRLQISRGSLAPRDVPLHQVGDSTVGLLEDYVHELAGVDLGKPLPHKGGGILRQFADGSDFRCGPGCCLVDCLEHEEKPRLPRALARDFEEQAVVIHLVRDDVAAQI